jgi:hypothetical protein
MLSVHVSAQSSSKFVYCHVTTTPINSYTRYSDLRHHLVQLAQVNKASHKCGRFILFRPFKQAQSCKSKSVKLKMIWYRNIQ